jgi:hypothetical protein
MVRFPSPDPSGEHPPGEDPSGEGHPSSNLRDPDPGRPTPTSATRASLSEQGPPSALERLARLGDEIAELQAHLHAATHRMLERLREFDACFQEAGGGTGFRSTAHWLSWRTGIGLGAAREKVRVARALGGLPRLGAAMARGGLSYSKLRAVSRIATEDNEARLLEFALEATAAELERLVRVWRRADRLEEARGSTRPDEPTESEREARRRERRELSLYVDVDGTYVVKGRLEPEAGALFRKALEAAGEVLYRSEDRERREARTTGETPSSPRTSRAHRWADAVALLAQVALQGGEVPGKEDEEVGSSQASESSAGDAAPSPAHALRTLGRSDRFQVVVHVDAEVLAEPERAVGAGENGAEVGGREGEPRSEREAAAGARSGAAACGCRTAPGTASGRKYGDGRSWLGDHVGVSAETSRRLSCDASRLSMTHAPDGSVLNVGRRSRVVTAPIRRALEYRDGGCRFPGCGLRICEPHHIQHWAHGGETRMDNLVLLCPRHHQAVHEGGWRVRMGPDRQPRFFAPNGDEVPAAPPLPTPPPKPASRLREQHRFLGLEIDAWTASARRSGGWNPPAFDLNWVLGALRRREDVDASAEQHHDSEKRCGFVEEDESPEADR